MKDKKYLVILCSHVDSEKKKNKVIETLKHLKNEGIDVCFSSHSTDYLEEISFYSKFTIFDSNNEFITKNSYLQNGDLLDEDFAKYGLSFDVQSHSFGKVIDHKTGSPHSKSALSLLKNGISVSESNLYEWTIYLEYDIPIPLNGFRIFFEERLRLLLNNNKNCFYYLNDTPNFKFLWGGFFMFRTKQISENIKLMKTDWFSNSRNWVSIWKLGFFESIVEFVLNESFGGSIINKKITDDSKLEWGTDSYLDLSKFKFEETFFKEENSLDQRFKGGVYPSVIDDQYKIHLYVYNRTGDGEILIKKLTIKGDDKTIFEINDFSLPPFCWNLWEIDFNDYNNISLDYVLTDSNYSKQNSEFFNTQNLKKITERLARIEFN
jgi:hypothetical protein